MRLKTTASPFKINYYQGLQPFCVLTPFSDNPCRLLVSLPTTVFNALLTQHKGPSNDTQKPNNMNFSQLIKMKIFNISLSTFYLGWQPSFYFYWRQFAHQFMRVQLTNWTWEDKAEGVRDSPIIMLVLVAIDNECALKVRKLENLSVVCGIFHSWLGSHTP